MIGAVCRASEGPGQARIGSNPLGRTILPLPRAAGTGYALATMRGTALARSMAAASFCSNSAGGTGRPIR